MCFSTIRIRNPSKSLYKRTLKPFIDIPCGRCPECLQKKRTDWVLRMKLEYQYCDSCYSVTLTYDNEHVPLSRQQHKRDLQLFFKKLRHHHTGKRSIKYVAVGEYGDKLGRPHFHVIIFNLKCKDFYDAIRICWNGQRIQFGDNKGNAYSYAMKHCIKLDYDDETKPFQMISKGIGSAYLTPKLVAWHRKTGSMTVTTFDGQKAFMPRYLREKIWPDEDERKRVLQANIDDLIDRGIFIDYETLFYQTGDLNLLVRQDSIHQAKRNHLKSINTKIHHK